MILDFDSGFDLHLNRGVELTGVYVSGQNVMASGDTGRAIVDTGVSARGTESMCLSQLKPSNERITFSS